MAFRPSFVLIATVLCAPVKPQPPRPDFRLTPQHQQLLRAHLKALALNFFTGKGAERIKDIPRWHKANHDCAGFIRYLLWEAHEKHDARWQQLYGSRYTRELQTIPYPRPALYHKGRAAHYVPAEAMALENGRLIARELKTGMFKTGDFLYYSLQDSSRHLMLVLEGTEGSALLVYHTGQPKNELRLIQAKDLMEHHSRWHPVPENPEFGGLYRFRFLD